MTVPEAYARLHSGQEEWDRAMRAHVKAPPDPQFAGRLRATSHAAAAQAAALEYAIEAGLSGKKSDPTVRELPFELRPSANRPGSPETWAKLDAAVEEWRAGWQGTDPNALARALRRLATLTELLADSVDAERGAIEADAEAAGEPQRRALGA